MTLALTALGALIAVGLYYAVACWWTPFVTCRRCDGTKLRTDWRGREKPCRRCRGTGYRLRIGRRIHNRATALHERGTR